MEIGFRINPYRKQNLAAGQETDQEVYNTNQQTNKTSQETNKKPTKNQQKTSLFSQALMNSKGNLLCQ